MINVCAGIKSVGQKPNALLSVYAEYSSMGALGGAPFISGFWGPVFDS